MQVQRLGAEERIYLLQLLVFVGGEARRLRPGGFRSRAPLGFFGCCFPSWCRTEISRPLSSSEGAGPGTAVAGDAVPPPPVGCCSFLGCSRAAAGSPRVRLPGGLRAPCVCRGVGCAALPDLSELGSVPSHLLGLSSTFGMCRRIQVHQMMQDGGISSCVVAPTWSWSEAQ